MKPGVEQAGWKIPRGPGLLPGRCKGLLLLLLLGLARSTQGPPPLTAAPRSRTPGPGASVLRNMWGSPHPHWNTRWCAPAYAASSASPGAPGSPNVSNDPIQALPYTQDLSPTRGEGTSVGKAQATVHRVNPLTQGEEKADFVIIPSEGIEIRTEEIDSPLSQDWQPESPGTHLETSWEEQLLGQQEHLEKETEEAKKMISGLQALLLNGSFPEDEQERPLALCEPGVNPEEQLITIQSGSEHGGKSRPEERTAEMSTRSQKFTGVKDALQQRLTQQDTVFFSSSKNS
ncbi:Dixin [Fukomys damarensis]|uniref:Dixin n=1 Tax=Fukomys damarensis TaxID=885580 RepID=A0A091DWI7_FUKDA|nr:Dixin [Fukomys damarensis]